MKPAPPAVPAEEQLSPLLLERQADAATEARLRELVESLTLPQQISLLTGADVWSTTAIPEIGLGRIVMSDGPSGVRGEDFDERHDSASLPSSSALSATWSVDQAFRYGQVLGQEARRKGVHAVLGPTINLHRSPLGGRHFECMSEDPLLTARMAAGYVAGVQSMGVGATPKHYIANEAETERFTADSVVAERPLRELYLAAFEEAVTEAKAWLVMSSYNSINGTTASENELLKTPLCTEWGFDGVVVSDWTGIRSTEASANARQDLEMPGPNGNWGPKLLSAVEEGRVSRAAIVEKVTRILRLAARVGALEGFQPAVSEIPAELDVRQVARDVAVRGAVLVRNEGSVLPLDTTSLHRVAVIGHNAQEARIQGGGSATVMPRHVISPLEGLQDALPGVKLSYARGAKVAEGIQPLLRTDMANPSTGGKGVRVTFLDKDGSEISGEDRYSSQLIWFGIGIPEGTAAIRASTDWTAPSSGAHHLGVATVGSIKLTVAGRTLFDGELENHTDVLGAALFFPPTFSASVEARHGQVLRIEVTYQMPTKGRSSLRTFTFGTETIVEDPQAEIAEAVQAARDADVAVVVVGTNSAVESEGFDRTDLNLPGHQDRLVEAVAAANPRTVVVVNSGAPVLMPWRERVAAILLGWFGGQEFGAAIADILLGAQEPGGRLPTTWPAAMEDVPVLSTTPVSGKVVYQEGIHIGYRAWLKKGLGQGAAPAYPFGFGLGYTTFERGTPTAPAVLTVGEDLTIEVPVRNIGKRAGREVVQVYLSREDSAVERPVRWLAGFGDIVLEPGAGGTVSVRVPSRSFAHYDGEWRTEEGTFRVLIGRHANDEEFQAVDVRVASHH
ncbi:glycoside hydrolase family 3 C-terminal domain-containing protein [Pseudarthrobacter sp. SL88]|uniref:beta-glucosidase family protein n=1 Tax=Pseudarthrobacter sp. SL88 TaxID=2994666 RepID=UPI00227369A0|nr:glycoside hydrolase family 3 C-terminal domain-containing protein [Pseudarthrobacter sp. SL88]MCY1674985.1 glycoside hydrolase family 3 C-terminal domain-containing protein [Pseudarthrobacter sp. SL88]